MTKALSVPNLFVGPKTRLSVDRLAVVLSRYNAVEALLQVRGEPNLWVFVVKTTGDGMFSLQVHGPRGEFYQHDSYSLGNACSAVIRSRKFQAYQETVRGLIKQAKAASQRNNEMFHRKLQELRFVG